MSSPALSKLELKILQVLWERGPSSVREVQEHLPPKDRLAYTTVQTILYRLEAKNALQRVRKISNAHIFEATLSRESTQRRLVDDMLRFFGGRSQPLVAHLVESGQLTLQDIKDAEKLVRSLADKGPKK